MRTWPWVVPGAEVPGMPFTWYQHRAGTAPYCPLHPSGEPVRAPITILLMSPLSAVANTVPPWRCGSPLPPASMGRVGVVAFDFPGLRWVRVSSEVSNALFRMTGTKVKSAGLSSELYPPRWRWFGRQFFLPVFRRHCRRIVQLLHARWPERELERRRIAALQADLQIATCLKARGAGPKLIHSEPS